MSGAIHANPSAFSLRVAFLITKVAASLLASALWKPDLCRGQKSNSRTLNTEALSFVVEEAPRQCLLSST